MSQKTVQFKTNTTWTVPSTIVGSIITIDVRGGAGGAGQSEPGAVGGLPGNGARVRGFYVVTPGQTLMIRPKYAGGAAGGTGPQRPATYGGKPIKNGGPGGKGGAGGYGAAVLKAATTPLAIAGGGGGGGGSGWYGRPPGNGGAGGTGGSNGLTGKVGAGSWVGSGGAGAQGQTPGNGGGVSGGNISSVAGTAGSRSGPGGKGSAGTKYVYSTTAGNYSGGGGGGGGGYAGGGGASGGGNTSATGIGVGGGGGGGGGSSFAASSLATAAITTGYWNSTTPLILISYTVVDLDLAPTFISPTTHQAIDFTKHAIIRFKRNPGAQSGTIGGWSLRKWNYNLTGGAWTWWTAKTKKWTTGFVQLPSPPTPTKYKVVNSPSYLTMQPTNVFVYNFPSGIWGYQTTTTVPRLHYLNKLAIATQGVITGVGPKGTLIYSPTHKIFSQPVPTTTAIHPSGTVTLLRPTVTWTNHLTTTWTAQRYYTVKIFTTTVLGLGSFTPSVSSAVWSSGLVQSSSTSVTVGTNLTNLKSYKAYVQIRESMSNSATVTPLTSVWTAGPTFTVNLPGPGAPTLTAVSTINTTSGHPQALLHITGAPSTADHAGFQFSLSTKGPWSTIVTGTYVPLVSHAVAFTWRHVPLGVTVYVRARLFKTVTTQAIGGTYCAPQTIAHASTYWWLSTPFNPGTEIQLYRAQALMAMVAGGGTASIVINQTEQQGQFPCFGRSNYIVTHGTMLNEEFTLALDFFTTGVYQKFLALRAKQSVLLLQSDMNGAFYFITLGPSRPVTILRSTTRRLTPIRQIIIHCYPTTP